VIAVLARPPLARLTSRPRAWLAVGAWVALALAFAAAVRHQGAPHGADHVLVDTYGAMVVPLLAYGIVGAVLGSQSLEASIRPLVGFGASPVRAAAASVAVSAVACAALAAALGAAVAVVAHGASDPPVARDAAVSAYAGSLGGLAYAAWFSLGASFGRRGTGRAAFLVADWLLGISGPGGALTPRGHLTNLLGGVPPLDLPQRASALALVGLALLYAAAAVRRARV
jgi:hypothetical protein